MRVLVVEDSEQIRRAVVKALKSSGYAVDQTGDGEEGLWLALENEYDTIILDIMLPGLDGRTLLKRLRAEERDTPVLFLTALDAIEDRVEGFRLGADDYLVKSFAIEELLARVGALVRRRYKTSVATLEIADLVLDQAAKTVHRGGRELILSPQNYSLLQFLLLRKGEVVSRSEIEERIYDEHVSPTSNVVESAVYALRKAIAVDKESIPLIHTRRGLGYVLEDRR